MDVKKISLETIRKKTVAVLGYGNQGRTHALNLRDSGVSVRVGARPGKGFEQAKSDGFEPASFRDAAAASDILMFLFADQVIPGQYDALKDLMPGKIVGFAHGYVYHFKKIEPVPGVPHFLAAPKGPGAVLRENFTKGGGLPGAFAVTHPEIQELAQSYCKAVGIASSVLLPTNFQEETEGDLFGEQAVLCGGLLELMENAFEILVENGHQPETAFFDVCYEASVLLQLWIKFGPEGFAQRISPTAFYGGSSRGKRIINSKVREEMARVFQEVRNGKFSEEWGKEVAAEMPSLQAERKRIASSLLQKTYSKLAPQVIPQPQR